jgi:hypothetical protein
MAEDDDNWATIVRALRAPHHGRRHAADLVVLPGGRLGRIAATRCDHEDRRADHRSPTGIGPTSADATEISRLDPDNLEHWTPVWHGGFGGWTFEMTPPIRGQHRFKFLVFRSPSDGSALRIAPVRPPLGPQCGRELRTIIVRFGGQEVPVISASAGRPGRSFADARGDAAQWMVYTSYRLAGLPTRVGE